MKINNYVKDANVNANDKWIGSDFNNFGQTKNFSPTSIAEYYNHNQVIDSPYLKFTYQTLNPGEQRYDGTISFVSEIGPSVAFSSISTFLLSKKSLKDIDVSNYIGFLNGGKVILSRGENIDDFGFYKITNIIEYVTDTNFFVVSLDYIAGHGSMVEDKDYLVSLVADSYTLGEIPTKTSDLTNDGEDGINPFITLQDLPPSASTLKEVLINGNVTDGTDIVLSDGDAIALPNASHIKKGSYDFGAQGGISRVCGVGYEDMWQSGIRHVFDSNGFIRNSTNCFNIVPDNTFDSNLRFKVGSIWTLDDGTSYICTDATVGVAVWEVKNNNPQTLQEVTDNGNITTNGITVGSIIAGNFYADGYSFGISDNFDTNYNLQYLPYVGLILDDFAGNQSILNAYGLQLNAGTLSYTGPAVGWNLPSASGIIALTSDITTALAGYATQTWVGSNYYPLSSNPAGYLTSSSLAGYLTTSAAALTYFPIPTGTTSQYIRGDGTLATFPSASIPTLQQVVTSGNIITTSFTHQSGAYANTFNASGISIADTSTPGLNSSLAYQINGIFRSYAGLSQSLVFDTFDGLYPPNRTITIPNKTGTMALLSDIPTGGGLPAGGTAGQILTKVDATDYNATWQENYADWTSVVKHTVKNNGVSLITKGTPVYVTSSNGTNMLVGKASNTSEATSSKTMGLMQSDITTTGGTQTGFVITEGLLGGLNTAGTTAGDPVWLGVNGALIYGLINKPYAPAHLVFIGIVTKVSAGNGEIFVKIQNGFELKEIHDVDLITTTPSNGDVLTYETSSGLWKNKSVIASLGYTPYDSTNPNGYTSNTGTVTSVAALTLGTTGADVSSTVVNGTTTPIITLNIPTASATNRGALSSADWSTFNGKQAALGYTPENVSNKSDSYTASSSTTYSNTKALVDGLLTRTQRLYNAPSQITHTGTTAKTILLTYFIPANTLSAGDFLNFSAIVTKVANISNTAHTIEINTTNTLVGASLLASVGFNTTNFFMKLKREFIVNGGNIFCYTNQVASTPNDQTIGSIPTVMTSFTYNLAQDMYLFVTCTLSNATDSITYRGISLTRN